MGVLGYADDLAILSPPLQGLKYMVKIYEQFAIEYHIRFDNKKLYSYYAIMLNVCTILL